MPNIIFEKTVNDCNHELVKRLCAVSTFEDMLNLEEEFGQTEVVDTMFAIAEEKGTYVYGLLPDVMIDWLYYKLYEYCYEYVRGAFLDFVNEERRSTPK